jgi:Mg-chelatase subunit ChlD
LRQIDAAANEWALEKGKHGQDIPTAADLTPYLKDGKLPTPVMGETYVLGKLSDSVHAEMDAKKIPKGFQKVRVTGQKAYITLPGESVNIASAGSYTMPMRSEDSPKVPPTSAPSPVASASMEPSTPPVATEAPAPVLAPPPTPIVLPNYGVATAGLDSGAAASPLPPSQVHSVDYGFDHPASFPASKPAQGESLTLNGSIEYGAPVTLSGGSVGGVGGGGGFRQSTPDLSVNSSGNGTISGVGGSAIRGSTGISGPVANEASLRSGEISRDREKHGFSGKTTIIAGRRPAGDGSDEATRMQAYSRKVAGTVTPGPSVSPAHGLDMEPTVATEAPVATPPPQSAPAAGMPELPKAEPAKEPVIRHAETFARGFIQSADDNSLKQQIAPGNGALAWKDTDSDGVVTPMTGLPMAKTEAPLLSKNSAAPSDQFIVATNFVSQKNVDRLARKSTPEPTAQPAEPDAPIRQPAPNTPLPQPEILTGSNAFSTFSLNVSDVSFKLAEASLQNGRLPDTASIRSEEFINAFDYRDPEAAPGQPMAFMSERARYPFAQNRELLRFAVKTAAAGRPSGRALNLVLLLDNSGSMERADRVAIIREALRVLAAQLQPQDTVSIVTFARTARLWADGLRGDQVGATLEQVGGITPEGGTNLEEAMRLAYATARRHYLPDGMNRVVLMTDGAANLGNVDPDAFKQKVDAQRQQGIALDCFGIGWEDLNDDLLELLSSNGGGRYAFLNSPEDVAKEFAAKLAGALQIAAADVKVQVEFNPARVISYRQIGYAKHQLTKEQFRDNTVAAGEIAAQEAGNALYTIETNPKGDGPVATVHVRYRIPGTQDYREHGWDVAYTGTAPALDQSSAAMRLAATASAFSEWLAASPYAQEVTLDELQKLLRGVPEIYGADDRPKQLETMLQAAKSLEGK